MIEGHRQEPLENFSTLVIDLCHIVYRVQEISYRKKSSYIILTDVSMSILSKLNFKLKFNHYMNCFYENDFSIQIFVKVNNRYILDNGGVYILDENFLSKRFFDYNGHFFIIIVEHVFLCILM